MIHTFPCFLCDCFSLNFLLISPLTPYSPLSPSHLSNPASIPLPLLPLLSLLLLILLIIAYLPSHRLQVCFSLLPPPGSSPMHLNPLWDGLDLTSVLSASKEGHQYAPSPIHTTIHLPPFCLHFPLHCTAGIKSNTVLDWSRIGLMTQQSSHTPYSLYLLSVSVFKSPSFFLAGWCESGISSVVV